MFLIHSTTDLLKCFLTVFLFFYGPLVPGAQADSASPSIQPDQRLAVPYCGIHSLYAAALDEGVDLSFDKLILGKYVGCALGSTLAELESAATDNGFYALPAANLDFVTLEQSKYPVLLHVKPTVAADRFDHYVVFLGMRQDKAMVLDPGNPIALVSATDLSSKWDGMGLIVSAKPIATAGMFGPTRLGFLLVAMLLIDAVLAAKRFNLLGANDRVGISRLSQRSIGILAAAAIVAFIFNLASPAGLLASGGPTEQMAQAHNTDSLPILSLAETKKLHDAGDAVFIDARIAEDYAAGHLDGAISLPVNATDAQRQAAVANIPKGKNIVIYCESDSCPFSGEVAHLLYADGYQHLSLYKGGWREWDAAAKAH
jgi:rhodanese-related sulfurtransferase